MGEPFNSIDEALISCIANQVAVAMRFAIQMEEAKKATQQKDALLSYIRNMNANTNVPSLLFTLNKAAQELLEADRCTFYTINHEAKTLHLINTDAAIDIVLNMGQGIAGSVATSAKKVNIHDCYEDNRFDQSFDHKTGYKTVSMLVMPVFADITAKRGKDKPIAVVQLINKQKGDAVFTSADEEILMVLLKFVGPLIKNSQLFAVKKKKNELGMIRDLKTHQIDRQPSRTFDLETVPIEEGSDDDDVSEHEGGDDADADAKVDQ